MEHQETKQSGDDDEYQKDANKGEMEESMKKKNRRKATIFITLSMIFVQGNQVFSRIAVNEHGMNPVDLMTFR